MQPLSPSVFKKQYLPYALESERLTGISALFSLAQAALETGWGAHTPGNMFFGIKATALTPDHLKQLLRTQEILPKPARKGDFPEILSITPLPNGKYLHVVKDWFRRYDSPAESFLHHARLLTRNPRYRQALLHREDPLDFAHYIAQAGYATDPDYEGKLRRIIRKINEQ